MTPAGLLRQSRVRFESQDAANDDYGNVLAATWTAITTVSGYCSMKPGTEAVAAGRLEAAKTAMLKVRRSTTTAALTEADRAAFVSGPFAGRTAQIRSIVQSEDFRELHMVVEFGVAT